MTMFKTGRGYPEITNPQVYTVMPSAQLRRGPWPCLGFADLSPSVPSPAVLYWHGFPRDIDECLLSWWLYFICWLCLHGLRFLPFTYSFVFIHKFTVSEGIVSIIGSLQSWWPQFLPSLFMYLYAVFPVRRVESLPLILNLGWPCDYLWPIEYRRNDVMWPLGLALQSLVAFVFIFLESSHHMMNLNLDWWMMWNYLEKERPSQPPADPPVPAAALGTLQSWVTLVVPTLHTNFPPEPKQPWNREI